jgi:hypothetical protein
MTYSIGGVFKNLLKSYTPGITSSGRFHSISSISMAEKPISQIIDLAKKDAG